MANEPYITKKDLENVTQKVTIDNAKHIAQPLIDQQKKNDLKELEQNIENKVLFQDIADSIKGLGDSLISGLKSLIPKTDGGLSKLLGLGLGLLLAPFVGFISFLGQLGRELNFFTKGRAGKFLEKLKVSFKGLFSGIFDKLKNSKLGKWIGGIIDRLKNSKLFKSITGLFQKVFGAGKGGFFTKLGKFFGAIKKFATGGPFKAIMKFAGSIGRILGKVFLPITILMGIFDFVKGFMKGYSEDGIIGGIKEGFNSLFDGLVGGLLRLLTMIPSKIAEWLGFEELSKQITENTEVIIQSIKDAFGGIVDLVKGIFMWDTEKIMEGLTKIWNSIVNVVMIPFNTIKALVTDVFGGSVFERMKLTLKQIGLTIQSFFLYLQQGVAGLLDKIPDIFLPDAAEDFIDDLNEGTRILKSNVDSEISDIKDMKAELKKKDELQKKLKLEEESKKANSGANINMQDGGTAVNTTNNVTYVIQNGSNVATDALQAAAG